MERDDYGARFQMFCWGGEGVPNVYSWGWWTGKDGDLHCVVRKLGHNFYQQSVLSPIHKSRVVALVLFLMKRLLCRLDENFDPYGDWEVES